MSQETVISRFAPSPTGLLHTGNARTALFNYLFARHTNGKFLLRIEDTDQERSRDEYVDALQADLDWLGMHVDLGPGSADGEQYYQSARNEIYQKYYGELHDKGLVYPCFCSPEALAMSRKAQRSSGQAPRYAGTCASLAEDEIQRRLENGEKPTLRFRVPGEIIEFHDLVRGRQQFAGQDIGDFIIRRADGTPAFFFCNAIDDALMNVTHVLRGEDHLTNTPRQLMILRALGLREPGYAHISLILGDDGTPLSKRNGSMSMSDMRSSGYLPLAMINFLARLGHRYEAEGLLSAETLAQDFSPDRLGKAPARFDRHQLDYYQKQALLSLNDEAFLAWVAAHIDSSILARIPADERLVFISAMRDNIAVPADAALWINASYAESLDYTDESRQVLETAGEDFLAAAIAASDNAQDFKSLASTVKTETGCKGKQLFMPLRHALTGQGHGPELGRLFELKGREWIRKRLSDAHAALQA